jgi:hypothetical protein
VIVALAVSCGGGGMSAGEPARLQATVARPLFDTLHFAVPAAAHHCAGRKALLLEAANEQGNGVLVLLRYGDSLGVGPVPLIALGDSITPRGANVAVRYMKGDIAHGVSLDSGVVDLTAAGDVLAARVRGSGLETGQRIFVDATYAGVRRPSPGDTVPCGYAL